MFIFFIFSALYRFPSTRDDCMLSVVPLAMFSIYLVFFFLSYFPPLFEIFFIFSVLRSLASTLQLAQSHTKWHRCIFLEKFPVVLFNILIVFLFIFILFFIFSALCCWPSTLFLHTFAKSGLVHVSQNCFVVLFCHTPLIYLIF